MHLTEKIDIVSEYYKKLGFYRNPFETNTAEREPEIEKYVVRPPYLDPIEDASKHTGSYTLSGSRGSGKSATRITVHRNILNSDLPHNLPIALTNFEKMRGVRKTNDLLDSFAKQIFFLTIEACLVYLTSLDSDAAEQHLLSFDSDSKRFIDWAIKNYYLNRPQNERDVSAQECFDTFSVSFARQSKLWAEKRWDTLTASLINIADAIAKTFNVELGDTEQYKKLLSSTNPPENIISDPLFTLKKAVEFSRIMGFSGLLIQVDKIDETDWTTNDAETAAKLVWPIFSNVQLHEIDGLSWSFFLWDRVRGYLINEYNMPVRWDKLPNDKIKWDAKHLQRLVERRINFFSNGALNKISELFDHTVIESDVYKQVLALSGLSPRILVTVLNNILTDHIHTHEGIVTPLSMQAVHNGLDNYARISILNDYSPDTIAQLKKLNKITFVTKDVAKAFSIGQQGARQKIEKWINSGLARKNGQVHAGDRVKPVDEFIISEPRAKRVVERDLDIYTD